MSNFDTQYKFILSRILEKGHEEYNKRTGMSVKALPGVTVQVDLQNEFPILGLRKIPVKNFIAEMMWFISGEKNTNVFLNSHTKIWDSFTEENGDVECAYGYRWRYFFSRDQLEDLISLLQKDSSSRHGLVWTWDPASDGLGGVPKKNLPCLIGFSVNIIGGRLHLHNTIRSNDMVLGFPTDVAGFALLQLILAQKLNVLPGIYTHSISNAHVYSNHYEATETMINRTGINHIPIELPHNCYERAKVLDETLFDELMLCFDNYEAHDSIKDLVISL